MSRYEAVPPATTEEAFQALTVEHLKPLVALITRTPPTRKAELVDLLARTMRDEQKVRALYDQLGDLAQAAVREAVHSGTGELDVARFTAKYGQSPPFDQPRKERRTLGYLGYGHQADPTTLRLFFPSYTALSKDLCRLLASFVPEPAPFQLATVEELPETVPETIGESRSGWPGRAKTEQEQVPLRAQATEQAALHDVHAVLRLVDAGKLSVGATTRRPTQAALRAVAGALHSGDFYGEEDAPDWPGEKIDLQMKAFAWPMIVQAAGFAGIAGSKLQLTPSGRKAMSQPAHEVIRTAWRKWLGTTLLDEFSRVNAIKGQGGKGKHGLTAMGTRRRTVAEALADSPAGAWIAVDELFRYMRATDFDFEVTRDPSTLYIAEWRYGNLAELGGSHGWTILQGRYVLAVLFEYAATMGLVDVAYVSPVGARGDYDDLWGTDDLPYLSRYDGLRYARITGLGAWCLGQTARYVPAPVAVEQALKVLPNLDVVVTGRQLAPGDALFLERFAEQTGDAVWHLSQEKCLAAMEDGLLLSQLREFLAARSGAPLPQTVEVFLADLDERAGRLRDLGAARLIECQDAALAHLLANDRRLRDLCFVAGDRHLVFRAADEPTVRRALRDLGYTVPPAR